MKQAADGALRADARAKATEFQKQHTLKDIGGTSQERKKFLKLLVMNAINSRLDPSKKQDLQTTSLLRELFEDADAGKEFGGRRLLYGDLEDLTTPHRYPFGGLEELPEFQGDNWPFPEKTETPWGHNFRTRLEENPDVSVQDVIDFVSQWHGSSVLGMPAESGEFVNRDRIDNEIIHKFS